MKLPIAIYLLLHSVTFIMMATEIPSTQTAAAGLHPDQNLPELHRAIIAQDLKRVEQLLKDGADVNQLDAKMGNAPLHIAAQCDLPEMIDLLLKHGAFVNLQTPRAGHTPLMVATWYSKLENVKALMKAEDLNLYATTPYGGAAARDLIGGGDPAPSESDRKRNAMLTQLFDEHEARIKALAAGQKIYQVVISPEGSPEEKADEVRKLIAQGESVNTVSLVTGTGNDRHSPLLVAARENKPELVKLLLAAGADLGQRGYMMNAIPFHKAGYMGNPEVLEQLLAHPDAAALIDDQGLNNGYTPLHDAIWHGHTEAALLFIQAGARLDLRTYEGDTPLDLARRYGYQDIAEALELKLRSAVNSPE